jgi:hypothetical protein
VTVSVQSWVSVVMMVINWYDTVVHSRATVAVTLQHAASVVVASRASATLGVVQ